MSTARWRVRGRLSSQDLIVQVVRSVALNHLHRHHGIKTLSKIQASTLHIHRHHCLLALSSPSCAEALVQLSGQRLALFLEGMRFASPRDKVL